MQIFRPPVPPEVITKETLENLKPLPKCVHGMIHNLCTICNKEFYFPNVFKKES